jgi:hypothetical protein
MEFIFSADTARLSSDVQSFLSVQNPFASCHFLIHAERDLAAARIAAVSLADSDLVAFAEDHGFPDSNWAEEILAAFESSKDTVAAAPVMLNANPGTAVSRAQFLLTHGRHGPGKEGIRFMDNRLLPWHSTVYRKVDMIECADDVGLFHVEVFLQKRLFKRHQAARSVRCLHTSVSHVNMSRLKPAVSFAFHGGRIYGSERALRRRWGLFHRLPRAILFPLVALQKIARSAPLLWDRGSATRTLANFAIAIPLSTTHAFGEAVGTVFGKGLSHLRYAEFEVDRSRLLLKSERQLLFPMSVEATAR